VRIDKPRRRRREQADSPHRFFQGANVAPRLQDLGIWLTALFVCLCAPPSYLPESIVGDWPRWARRHIVLGLDLQGGSHLLLEVDTNSVRHEILQSRLDEVRRVLRQARVGNSKLAIQGDSVDVDLRDYIQTGLAKLHARLDRYNGPQHGTTLCAARCRHRVSRLLSGTA
jgi:preprotein translocase subunit SecD